MQPIATIHATSIKSFSGAIILASLVSLNACSSSDDDSSPTEQTADVSAFSDEELKDNAAVNFGSSLNSSSGAASDVVIDNSATGTVGDTANENGELLNEPVDSELRSLMRSSLALNDDGERTTREGNRVTIDPDETEVCAEQALDNQNQMDVDRCEALIKDVIVQLDAINDTSGTISYFYQDKPLATIGYADNADSMEIFLDGLKVLSDANDALDPETSGETNAISTVNGAIKMSATNSNSTQGAVAGAIALQVTQAIILGDDDGGALSLGTGTLFDLSMDESTETGRLELDIGKLATTVIVDWDELGIDTYNYDLDGLTAIIDLDGNSESMTVSNLGLANGPFIVALNGEVLSEMSLDTFGFTVASDGAIVLTSDLNLRNMFNDFLGNDDLDIGVDVATLETVIEITAPSGTGFIEQENGSTLISSGGPFAYSITQPDDVYDTVTIGITAGEGSCYDELPEDGLEYAVPTQVNCD